MVKRSVGARSVWVEGRDGEEGGEGERWDSSSVMVESMRCE